MKQTEHAETLAFKLQTQKKAYDIPNMAKVGNQEVPIFCDVHCLTLWPTQPPVRQSEPLMSLLLVLAFCQ
jgi:hypothetical protein